MEQEILTPDQKSILSAVSEDLALKEVYLSGGTALSGFYFHHRLSEDLDFFSDQDFDVNYLHAFVETLKKKTKATSFEYQRLYDRNIFVLHKKGEEIKIEFTLYPFKKLNPRKLIRGVKVDSLRDIAANKLMAMLDRFDPKDYVDLYFLLQKTPLQKVRADAEKKFNPVIPALFLGSQLSNAKHISALPKMLKPLTIEELKDFFEGLCKKLSNQVIE